MSFWIQPKLLFAAVTTVHVAILGCFAISKPASVIQREPTQLVVSTVKLKPKAQPVEKNVAPAKQGVAAPKSKPQPQPVAKKVAPAKKSEQRLAKLRQEAQDRLAKVAGKIESGPTKSAKIDLAIDSGTYEMELAERLRLLLKLPEWGSVRLSLTIARDGHVVALEVLEAQSDVNRTYVVSHLEGQSLAPLGKEYAGEAQHTFRLTLNNEL